RRQPIEPDAEEALVQGRDCLDRRSLHVRDSDVCVFRNVPTVSTPLLQAVRVPVGFTLYAVERSRVDVDILGSGWYFKRLTRRRLVKRPDLHDVEQAFCVRLGPTHAPRKLR